MTTKTVKFIITSQGRPVKKHVIIMLALVAFALAGCAKREPVVARVAREKITAAEFKDGFVQRFRGEDNAKHRSYQDRERFVNEMALDLAKYQEGTARGILKRPEVADQLKQLAQRKALDHLYQAKVVDAVITDAAVRDYYDKSEEEVHARHILLRTTPMDTVKKDSVQVKVRIDSIKKAIDQGLSFKAAAAMFSEDATSAADSGDLGWFGWGRMVDEFQQAAWSAKIGEVVGPVRTSYGYHLIVVEEKRRVQNRQPFEQAKEQIKNQLREVESGKLMETARAYVENLRKKNGLTYNETNSELFRKKLADPTTARQQTLGPAFTEEPKKLVVATYKGGQVTIQDLIEKVGNNAYRVEWTDTAAVKDLIHSIVEPKFLDKDAEQQGLLARAAKDPAVLSETKQLVIRTLEKEEITDKVKPTDQDERNYYDAHLSSFIQPEMRTIREIFIKGDSLKAARVRAKAVKGENFTKLATRYNEKESTKADTGRLGPFEQRQFGLLGKTAFLMKTVGEVSDVVPVGENYSVVQLIQILPSRTKTFEEARADVKRQCRTAQTDEAQRALDQMLLKKYKVQIDAQQLAAVWPIEEKKKEDKLARQP
jgi:parvulin-like peptidyl-prolyl isomerase